MYFNCSVLSPRGVTSRCPGLGSQRTFYANVRAVTRGSYSDSDYGDSVTVELPSLPKQTTTPRLLTPSFSLYPFVISPSRTSGQIIFAPFFQKGQAHQSPSAQASGVLEVAPASVTLATRFAARFAPNRNAPAAY